MEWPDESDALMYREIQQGESWDVKRVAAHKVQTYRDGGWHVLLQSADMPSTQPQREAA